MGSTLSALERERLIDVSLEVRAATVELCEPLSAEDMVVQSMPAASPTKWHLAHVTWFFETILLTRYQPGYERFDPRFHDLFNSYYQSLGDPFPRDKRGLLSRPAVHEPKTAAKATSLSALVMPVFSAIAETKSAFFRLTTSSLDPFFADFFAALTSSIASPPKLLANPSPSLWPRRARWLHHAARCDRRAGEKKVM